MEQFIQEEFLRRLKELDSQTKVIVLLLNKLQAKVSQIDVTITRPVKIIRVKERIVNTGLQTEVRKLKRENKMLHNLLEKAV